jgi:predicted  nucleic acid-binding Zn-ribbon protein
MTVLWDKIKKNVIDSLNLAIDKSEELTSVGRIKLEILQLEHRLDEKFAELGRFVYRKSAEEKADFSTNDEFLNLQKEISKLEKELSQKEAELGRIKSEDGIDFD